MVIVEMARIELASKAIHLKQSTSLFHLFFKLEVENGKNISNLFLCLFYKYCQGNAISAIPMYDTEILLSEVEGSMTAATRRIYATA